MFTITENDAHYDFSADYAVARKKLKLAEQLSDVNTCSDQDDYNKKSRKFRAAKTHSSSNYDSEESDESVMLSLPKPPYKRTDLSKGTSTKKNLRHIKV